MNEDQPKAIRAAINSLSDKELAAIYYAAAGAFSDDISRNEASDKARLGKRQRAALWVKLRDMGRE